MISQQPVVVYVEDDEPSIYVMRTIFERIMGLKTFYILRSSTDFLQQVNNIGITPTLFLLDIQIQPCDGFELLSILRNSEQYAQSKVVALTASVMNEQVARLKQSGFNGAIAKPLDIDAFPTLIARIMKGESVWYIS
jgi:CheY-like chemotaxis protein